jgi:hypothetical protein
MELFAHEPLPVLSSAATAAMTVVVVDSPTLAALGRQKTCTWNTPGTVMLGFSYQTASN